MMRVYYFFIISFVYSICGGYLVYAQNIGKQISIPRIIQNSCLLTHDGYIDYCPEYWTYARDVNIALRKIFVAQEMKGSSVHDIDTIIVQLKSVLQNKRKELMLNNMIDSTKNFIISYMVYMYDLYRRELAQTINYKETSKNLFRKTYYDRNQSGLQPLSVSVFQRDRISVGETRIPLSFEVRNYSHTPITFIKDAYCFSTIGNTDFIFPVGLGSQVMKGNNITNFVLSMIIPSGSPLTQIPGSKNLACMIAYNQDGLLKKSDFVEFSLRVDDE